MTEDRELLEAAAETAGIEIEWDGDQPIPFGADCAWNPLTDDGDALRLAVKLRISVIFDEGVRAEHGDDSIGYLTASSISSDTRRAIVRAAAAMAG